MKCFNFFQKTLGTLYATVLGKKVQVDCSGSRVSMIIFTGEDILIYKRSLQPSKDNIQHLKHLKFLHFIYLYFLD
jgi:hypothetical protein